MLAIIILVGVFYMALNYSDKVRNNDHSITSKTTQLPSFKDNERHINERVDFQAH